MTVATMLRPRSLLLALCFVSAAAACGGEPAPAKAPVVAAPALFPQGWPYAAKGPSVTGAKGMVSSDATLASKVGLEVLESGGNAVDAAVATAFAMAVVYPAAGNVGGGGFMVARVGGVAHALDFRETAPGKATRDVFVSPDGSVSDAARDGHRAVGVPGSVAGLHEAFTKLGSKAKRWEELVAPAIRLAEEGFVVDEVFNKMITYVAEHLRKYPASAALFLPGGGPPAVGSTFKNPDLAKVLRRIASDGPKGFYEGATAELIQNEMKLGSGLMTTQDLSKYKAKWRVPLELTYRGHKMIAMPPPSSGGVTLGMVARILEGYEIGKMPFQSTRHLHLEIEALRRAFAARNARLGDPDFVKNPLDELLSETWAKAQRATIRLEQATPSSEIVAAPSTAGDGPHTTHFSVVDPNGNAVALTTTINWWFGSGVTVTGGGFLLNNEMDDFASKPGTANGFGLVQGEPNAIAPGKRMLSSMTPTIVLRPDGRVLLVTGAAGGPTIISTVFGIVSNVLDFGLDATTAVNAPRIHHQHMPDVVSVEPNGLSEETRKGLAAMGHALKERDHIADAPSIGAAAKGWIGAPEPRRGGAYAAGW